MPVVTLADIAFAELKMLAEPFVDTPESLVARLIHEEVQRRGLARNGRQSRSIGPKERQLNPDTHESLAFTRVLSAEVDGRELTRPKWNGFMNRVHVVGLKRLATFDALRLSTGAQVRKGRYQEEGFSYLAEGDFSIQGADSNGAWDNSLRLARTARIPIRVAFEWRDKEGAKRPGESAVLEWRPSEDGPLQTS